MKHLAVCFALVVGACGASDDMPTPEPLTACWIETAHQDVPLFGAVTASGLLLRHPHGDVLVDAGNSTHFTDEIQVYDGADRWFMENIVGMLQPTTPLPEALAAVGTPAADVATFVPTHIHVDHVGGLMDLPDLPVMLPEPELMVLQMGLMDTLFEVVPAHAARMAPLAQPLIFDGPPAYGAPTSLDLYADGSIVIVPLPGHTPGSVGVVIDLGDERVFHVGDAVSTLTQLQADAGKTFPMDRTDSDAAAALATVHQLHQLALDDPSLVIVPAHDRAAWQGAFAGGPGTCREAIR